MEEAEEYCEFELLHFKDMDREYTANSSSPSVGDVETIIPEFTEYGLKFSTKSFSPYVLMWNITAHPANNVLKVSGPEGEMISIDDESTDSVSLLESGNNDSTESAAGRTGDLPDTGEAEDVRQWACLMLICAAGAVASEIIRRRLN
jgi:hypothetical protein